MTSTPTDSLTETPAPERAGHRTLRYLVAAALLAASVALAVRTVSQVTRHASVLAAPATRPFSDVTERIRRQQDAIGTFATGGRPGDRVIVVQSDGHVRFYPVGPLRPSLEISDTYEVAQRNGHTCLVTSQSGLIEMLDIDHVGYFDDVYERQP